MLLTEKQIRLYNRLAIKGKKRIKKKAIKKLDNHNFIKRIEVSIEFLKNISLI